MFRTAFIGLATLIWVPASAQETGSHPPVRGTIPMLINAADEPDAVSGEAPGSVAELLAQVALQESEHDVSESRGRWAMRELLALGFAQSDGLEARVAAALAAREDRLLLDQIVLMREDAWLEGFERAQALASLRPFTTHQVARVPTQGYDIPIVDHELVDAWIDYFTGKGRWFFERWLGRSERYIPMMRPILEQYGIPKDLVYLAMIESGFSAKAYSPAAAAGYWQFIPGTAKIYGMRMNAWADERRDFVLATHAAAKYLSMLHKHFGDWHLAWAGYNAGEGRIGRALAKTGAKTFWELVEQDALPRETQHYVPKIIAAAIVAKNKEHFGFARYDALRPLSYDEIEVTEALDLKLVAKELNVEPESLRELNPMLLYDITPPGKPHALRLPVGTAERVKTWAAALPPSQRLTYATHKIAKGDTLSSIAKIFNTTSQMVQDFNHVKSAKSLRVGQELIIPSLRGIANKDAGPKGVVSPSPSDVAKLAAATPTAAEASATTASLPASSSPAPTTGQAPRTSPASLQKTPPPAASNDPNDVIVAAILARSREPGATGNPPSARPQKPIAPQPPPKGKASTHVVEAGDTLWSISQKYGATVADLKRWNGIRGSGIKAGDKLKIYQ
ncbi:MAG: LysM peptidoglycan-binding domain-containing protein [Myxococcota bacterium]